MNLVLIGSRCTGKTETGRVLSSLLGRTFVDTDDMVEGMAGVSIQTIVQTGGWGRFRDLETRAVCEASRADRLIVATGGGVATRGENMRFLRRNGWVVWLRAREETLKRRMAGDPRSRDRRPGLCGNRAVEEVRKILEERTPLYRSVCDLPLDTDGLSPSEVAARILERMPETIER